MNEDEAKELIAQQEISAKLLIRRDIELTRANEQLRSLDKMKTDFISVATHQLRTPLSAIRWTLSMILKEDIGPLTIEQRTLLMKAYESNNRMVKLLADILLSDHIESNGLKLTNEKTDILSLVENIFLELVPLANQRGVRLIFNHPDATYPMLQIDPVHMRAVLQNLLENAMKYSRVEGVATLTVYAEGPMLRITIQDSGIGIPLREQQTIFKRFFRATNAIRVETDGSGLGLYIVKSIIEKNYGTISFVSTENQGTTFTVLLPIAKT